MKLEKIITLANKNIELRFLAMERSLRQTGCELPLWVIPYDENRFDLPSNAVWWELPEISRWLEAQRTFPVLRKLQVLTTGNYQFVDSDIIFLSNPASILAPHEGFVASCGHWRDAGHTVTEESLQVLSKISTLWRRLVFNSGQFACDRALYSIEVLLQMCARYENTCLRHLDQPGIVLLANLSGVPISNLTLPPVSMESTWAGDYLDEGYADFWREGNRKPYLIHWAGCDMAVSRPIDRLFTHYLTDAERERWGREVAAKTRSHAQTRNSPRHILRRLRQASGAFSAEMRA